MLVNTIESECHIVVPRAVSIKNMKSRGVGYRLARSLLAATRRRIPPTLLATRTRVYWGILWA